jgi:hypothetical protein
VNANPQNPSFWPVHFGDREPPIKAGISVEIPFSGAARLEDRLVLKVGVGRSQQVARESPSSIVLRGKNALTGFAIQVARARIKSIHSRNCHFGISRICQKLPQNTACHYGMSGGFNLTFDCRFCTRAQYTQVYFP